MILALAVSAGCKPYPRFRTGGAEQPKQAVRVDSTRTTNDNLRLGMILQSYLGKPYRGRSKWEEGVDCSFFVQEVFKRYDGTALPRTVTGQFEVGREIPSRMLRYGDLVFFRTDRNKVGHVGVYVGDGRFIHASTSQGVIITGMSEKYWSQRFVGARRVLM